MYITEYVCGCALYIEACPFDNSERRAQIRLASWTRPFFQVSQPGKAVWSTRLRLGVLHLEMVTLLHCTGAWHGFPRAAKIEGAGRKGAHVKE